MIDRRLATSRFKRSRSPRSVTLIRGCMARPLVSFALVGACCTIAFAVLYNGFRTPAGPLEANVAALSLTMVLNFMTCNS